MNRKLYNYILSGDVDKFYNSRTWRKKRKQILERDNNECQRCKVNGGVGKGEVVHHKIHLKNNPLLALNDDNLITLCNACHNEVHPEKLNNNTVDRFTNPERWE